MIFAPRIIKNINGFLNLLSGSTFNNRYLTNFLNSEKINNRMKPRLSASKVRFENSTPFILIGENINIKVYVIPNNETKKLKKRPLFFTSV